MKFIYPYKLYLFGLFLFIVFSYMGMILILDIENANFFFIAVYVLYVIKMAHWYFKKSMVYKKKKVLVNSNGIIIFEEDEKVIITRSDLDMIIEFDHQQRFKIHHVLQIFTKDDKSFILTSELNKFNKLKKYLNSEFHDIYYIRSDTVRNTVNLREEAKMKHITK